MMILVPMSAYPEPIDYANKMLNWSQAIHAQYPSAEMAIIGWGMSNISDKGFMNVFDLCTSGSPGHLPLYI